MIEAKAEVQELLTAGNVRGIHSDGIVLRRAADVSVANLTDVIQSPTERLPRDRNTASVNAADANTAEQIGLGRSRIAIDPRGARVNAGLRQLAAPAI